MLENLTNLDNAVADALAYNRMGGRDGSTLKYIAHDFGVDYRDILEELEWGRGYYD